MVTPRSANQSIAPVQDGDGGDGSFVVVDLGVGDARVVVDDGVDGCEIELEDSYENLGAQLARTPA